MIDHELIILAMRERLLNHLSICTTAVTTLEATATGYKRDDGGSFLTDGFAAGMELTPVGFPQTTVAVIDTVTATVVTTTTARAVAASAASRRLHVALPATQAWENAELNTTTGNPTPGKPWVEEDYMPGGAPRQITVGPLGELEYEPLYVLKLYGVAGVGTLALSRYAQAVLSLFPPRTALTLSSGDVLRVRLDQGPYRGQQFQIQPGFAVVVVTVPLRIRTRNII